MADFPQAEFEHRLSRAQSAMAAAGLDALLLCTEAEVRYFTGFRTLFWLSPTRPWFLVLPRAGEPVAVIPEIGAELMSGTWVRDIRTWPAPRRADDGISLLCSALAGFSEIGLPMGEEASLRMPLSDFDSLRQGVRGRFSDCTALIRDLRMVKSSAEIAIIEQICQIASTTFERAAALFRVGQPLAEAFRAFRIALLEAGADDVPYLVGGAGRGGYRDIISPPGPLPLETGDILMLDTGATLQGYFCDFDRNFALGRAEADARAAYNVLWRATQAGLEAARPGLRACDLFAIMHAALGSGKSAVGRYGHGLGMQLTEWPSLSAADGTLLRPGMVITLEPSMALTDGRMMVHEENILITDDGARLLTRRAAPELPVI